MLGVVEVVDRKGKSLGLIRNGLDVDWEEISEI